MLVFTTCFNELYKFHIKCKSVFKFKDNAFIGKPFDDPRKMYNNQIVSVSPAKTWKINSNVNIS